MFGRETPRRSVTALAATAIAAEIAIHAWLAPDHLEEVPYIGVLFVVASVLLAGVLIGLVVAPSSDLVWGAGTALCVGMAAAFVVSRTLGFPDYHEAWGSDDGLGLLALVPEGVFVLCARRGRPHLPLGWSLAGPQ